jgi:mannitol 2-dehydrogenase
MNPRSHPTLSPRAGIDLDDYKQPVDRKRRFSNDAVRDTVARLCAESYDRIPKWLLPVITENLARDERHPVGGGGRQLGALRQGVDENGERDHQVVDRMATS